MRHWTTATYQYGFDAVAPCLTEHVGKQNLPSYFSFLYGKLKTGGRLLNHCITRPDNIEPAIRKRGFINRYVFPDGELEGPGYLISLMHDTGFEVRHEENLREHYAKTLAAWCANLDEHWTEAVQEVGQGTARVAAVHGRLRLPGSRKHPAAQVLGVRLGAAKSPACRCGRLEQPPVLAVNYQHGQAAPRRHHRPGARTAPAGAALLGRGLGSLPARPRRGRGIPAGSAATDDRDGLAAIPPTVHCPPSPRMDSPVGIGAPRRPVKGNDETR